MKKIAGMNTRYYDLRREIVKAERRIAVLTERGEMWAQYNKYKPIRKQLAKVKPEKRELFEQRHSRELILYDAAARYLKELKDGGEEITPKAWRREIDLLTAQKQVDSIDMKAMREELKAVERLRKAADQLARQERDKPRDPGAGAVKGTVFCRPLAVRRVSRHTFAQNCQHSLMEGDCLMKQIILPVTVHLNIPPAPCPLAAGTGRRAHRPGAGGPCLPGMR